MRGWVILISVSIFFLFETTNLFCQTRIVKGTVYDAYTNLPLKGIKVGLKKPAIKTTTNSFGDFSLNVPEETDSIAFLNFPGRSVIRIQKVDSLTYNIYLSELYHIYDLSFEELMNIKVQVGTRGEERTTFNSPVPIDIITAEDIESTGLDELTSVLQRLVPSINTTRPTINDGTDHSYPFTLRGLGSDQVLVLINGKRMHNTSLVNVNNSLGKGSSHIDLNTIPVSTIERIEILRDGSAAQYGSDAISGIINIILKKDIENSLSAKYQESIERDGAVKRLNNSFGLNIGEKGFITFCTEIRERQATNRAGVYRAEDQILSGVDLQLLNKQIFRYGDAYSRDISLVTNSEISISDNSTFYSSILYNFRHGNSAGFYRKPSQNLLIEKYPNGFLPLITPIINDLIITSGVKSKNNDWNWDFSATFGVNSFEFNVENSCNVSLGPTSQSSFYCGTLGSSQTTFNLDVFRNIEWWGKNPLRFGFGSELRLETYNITAGEENSYIDGKYFKDTIPNTSMPNYAPYAVPGAQVFPGFMPDNETDKNRNSMAFYLDLEQNITDKLLFGIAGRYENFSDFGETSNGKISMRYAPIQKLIFRGTASTGFRAPALAQSYFTSTANVFISDIPYRIGTFSVDHPLSKKLGALPLKPETSINYSAGFATQLEELSLSFDYFYTEIENRIVLSGTYTLSNSSDSIINLLKEHGIGGARFFNNAIDTRTYGLDIVAKYVLDLSFGKFLFSAAYNFNKTTIIGGVRIPPIIAVDTESKDNFFDKVEKARVETIQPNSNLRFGINYNTKKIVVNLLTIYYSDHAIINAIDEPAQKYSGKWLNDLSFSYQLKKVRFTIGGHNIFDIYPDKSNYVLNPDGTPKSSTVGYIFQYNDLSPFGFNGADFYARIIVNF